MPAGRVLAATGVYAAAWVLYGLASVAAQMAMGPVHHPARVAGAACLAWAAGFVVVFSPGGIGVREAVYAALVGGALGASAAAAGAVAGRRVGSPMSHLAAVGQTRGVIVVWVVLGALAALAVSWVVFVAVLALLRPKGIDLAEAKRLGPDVARLVRDLARDRSLPTGVRTRLALLLAYLAMPIDLIPDFIPVLGYADDVIITGLVLRSVVRRAGPAAVDRHWKGTTAGLALVRHLAGIA